MKLTPEQRKQIDKLTAEGKTPGDIYKIMGLEYSTVHNYVNRFKNSAYEQKRRKPKTVKTSSVDKFIDTGKEMPPISPPGQITVIRTDREHVELWLADKFGSRLNKITTNLSERKPSLNFTGQNQLS